MHSRHMSTSGITAICGLFAKYFNPINQFFGTPIPPYRVLVAYFLDAVSNWSETNIVLNAYAYQTPNPFYHTYTLLYEIILSQAFIRIRAEKPKEILSDEKLWMATELIAFGVLKKLFNEFSTVNGTGYPQVDKFVPRFLDILAESNSFDELKAGIFNISYWRC